MSQCWFGKKAICLICLKICYNVNLKLVKRDRKLWHFSWFLSRVGFFLLIFKTCHQLNWKNWIIILLMFTACFFLRWNVSGHKMLIWKIINWWFNLNWNLLYCFVFSYNNFLHKDIWTLFYCSFPYYLFVHLTFGSWLLRH